MFFIAFVRARMANMYFLGSHKITHQITCDIYTHSEKNFLNINFVRPVVVVLLILLLMEHKIHNCPVLFFQCHFLSSKLQQNTKRSMLCMRRHTRILILKSQNFFSFFFIFSHLNFYMYG